MQTNNPDTDNMYQKMADLLGITLNQVMDFAMTMMVYTQGIGTLIASGIVKDTKEKYVSYASQYRFDIFKGIGCEGSYIGLSIHCQALRRRAETKCFYLRLFIYE